MVAQIFLEPFGEDAVAAYNVGLRLEQLLLLPAIGVTSAVLPFVSQNMGAGRTDRVREGFWLSVIVGSAIVRRIEANLGNPAQMHAEVGALARQLKDATKKVQ